MQSLVWTYLWDDDNEEKRHPRVREDLSSYTYEAALRVFNSVMMLAQSVMKEKASPVIFYIERLEEGRENDEVTSIHNKRQCYHPTRLNVPGSPRDRCSAVPYRESDLS